MTYRNSEHFLRLRRSPSTLRGGRVRGLGVTESKGVHTVRHFRRSRGDDGAAAVEFALLLVPFIVMCFGMISSAIMLNDKLSLTQGVREGARYGATLPYSVAGRNAFLVEIRTAARGESYGQIGAAAATYCVGIREFTGGAHWHLPNTGSAALNGPCPGAPSLPTGSIVVIGNKASSINLIVDEFSLTLGSTSVARYEGNS